MSSAAAAARARRPDPSATATAVLPHDLRNGRTVIHDSMWNSHKLRISHRCHVASSVHCSPREMLTADARVAPPLASTTQTRLPRTRPHAGPGDSCAATTRRHILTLVAAAPPVLTASAALSAPQTLWQRVDAKSLNKPLFNVPPSQQAFPAWLEGTWDCSTSFAGYSFPSQRIDKSRLVKDTSVPGFLKLSILQLADVGAGGEHQLRFSRAADGAVVEDKAFNLTSMVDALLRGPVVQAVDYVPAREPNRVTLRLVPGSTNNAERVELYINARESDTRPDGVFYALESVRQVALGYSRAFNAPRVAVTDYSIAWTFQRRDADTIQAAICTAGYVQPNEALQYTAEPGASPQLGGLLTTSTEPVVLYSHTVTMRRHLDQAPAPA